MQLVLGVAVALKDPKVRGLAVPSGISALLGITEPAMFGGELTLSSGFLCGDDWTQAASAFIAFFNVKAIALGAVGFLVSHLSNQIALRCTASVW